MLEVADCKNCGGVFLLTEICDTCGWCPMCGCDVACTKDLDIGPLGAVEGDDYGSL